ncbi:hypothetical protein PHLGIDRAFT_121377 [Phlebiopsis gigantea 11061_1 CR5-6]|uniref:PITH domain-containing protein n=1 Tax=Phlebiopsis gigantea (strain 11061_1 CR5-6) TaxID=745531 RepID=A0A0C3NG11_PHLG1|nr:hypothetical protein PHLGIDRAFT_121377 [Phlebiopsis gigantea 11061_1 CR5-6]
MEDALETSLLEALDGQQLNCLNEDAPAHTLRDIVSAKQLNTSPDAFLLSDVDEQLILTIPFNQMVRVRALVLTSKGPAAQRPVRAKIFVNVPTLGFDDATTLPPVQELELTETQLTQGARIPLRFVRFQSVNSLHIFIESNGGDEQTRIDGVDVLGTQAGTTRDLSGLRVTEE